MQTNNQPLSVTGKLWQLRPADERHIWSITQSHSLPEIVARLLVGRGIITETVSGYLTPTLRDLLPDPSSLLDMDKAVDRVLCALDKKEKIVVYGDYDVDGATASSLLRRYFHDIGHPIGLYIPDRIEEGYGANSQALEQLHTQGTNLILMVDCGTTSFEPLSHAHSLGLDVIVLDHHSAEAALPQAVAVINPNRLDQDLPTPETTHSVNMRHLCAAGVAFLFLVGVQRALRQKGWFQTTPEPNLLNYLDLVALGTVCDVMPLTGLNRAIVSQGLKVFKKRGNLGLATLADVASVSEAISAYHLGFVLGPRINAGGRVGQADLGSRLLSTSDSLEAQKIAKSLHDYNVQRQEIEKQVLEESIELIESKNLDKNPILLVGNDGWHPGVIGIVASRLKERYNRPACVVAFDNDVGKGSGRSIYGVEMGASMHVAVHLGLLEKGGGHAMAAGFTVNRLQFDAFYDFLNDHLGKQIETVTPILKLDGYLSLAGATTELLKSMQKLEPYGNGNSTPRFAFSQVTIPFSKVVGANHLSCQLQDPTGKRIKAIAFRAKNTPLGDLLEGASKIPVDIAGTIRLDSWNGQEQVSLTIEDARSTIP